MSKFTIATLFGVVAVITADFCIISLEHSEMWVSYMFGTLSVMACISAWFYPWIIKDAE